MTVILIFFGSSYSFCESNFPVLKMESSLNTKGEIYLEEEPEDEEVEEYERDLSIPAHKIHSVITWYSSLTDTRQWLCMIINKEESQKLLEKANIVKYLKIVVKPIDIIKVINIRFDQETTFIFPETLVYPVNIEYSFLDSNFQELTTSNTESRSRLSVDFSKLLDEDKFSDVVLRCEGGELKAHRSILSARSEYFEKMFNSNNLESTTRQVPYSFDRDVMFALLEFIYSEKIDESKCKDLLEAGDYYGLLDLKSSCEKLLIKNITAENAVSTLVFADAKNLSSMKEEVLNFIGKNFKAVTAAEEMLNLEELGINKINFELIQLIMNLAAERIN